MEKDIKTAFAKRLRGLRLEHGYTQEKLAEISGVDYKHIQKLEGQKALYDIKLTTIGKLAKAFEISVSELLEPCDPYRPQDPKPHR